MAKIRSPVALRLRAVKTHFRFRSNNAMGGFCGTSGSVVNNWLLSANPPCIPDMILLCERTGITLDWIYRGKDHAMAEKLSGELQRIMLEAQPATP